MNWPAPHPPRSAILRHLLPVGFVIVAAVVAGLAWRVLHPYYQPPFTIAVTAAAYFGGFGAGITALGLSTAVLSFLYPFDLNAAANLAFFLVTNTFILLVVRHVHNTQRKLHLSEERNRSVAELIPFGGWTADPQGNVIHVSDSFLNAFHVSLGEVAGLGWLKLIAADQRDQVLADWRECMRSGYFWDYEYTMKGREGETFTVLSRGIPVRTHTGRITSWVGIHLDITDRQRSAELRLQQAQDIARFNAELDQFAYVSSHDLQEPLRMIASYLQLLAKRYRGKLDPDADTYIGYAVEGAGRLQALLQDLLMLSQLGKHPERRRKQPLAKIVEDAKKRLAPTIQETSAEITYDALPELTLDAVEMMQLFLNLFDNAIKFRRPGVLPRIHVTSSLDGGMHTIRVTDNGIGFEPQFNERIFAIFQRLHARAQYPGTGIGLAICRKIVEVHGGMIRAESEPGSGSTFVITLPSHTRSADQAAVRPGGATSRPPGSPRSA